MFGVEAFPALAFILLLSLNPRSPRWLVSQNLVDEAKDVIESLGSDNDNVDEEIKEIKKSLLAERASEKEVLFQARYARPIWLAVAIAIFNQLSGMDINLRDRR